MTAKAIAVLGTGSDVGKSLIAAGLCRLLRRQGVRVAPFKAQNMSLNSFVTPEGGEIGRAQALQAEACGLPPHVDMNPILLKPEAENRSQIVVRGKVFAKLDAVNYFDRRTELWRVVQESYARLASQHDVVVIEGAGSAAEVNLRNRDLANWPVVQMADAKVVLVADIDRGGVFAQVVGTLDLLEPNERERICGIVINKFRGDRRLFDDGVRFLESKTGLPVLGVVPFLRDLALDQEDSLDLSRNQRIAFGSDRVNVAVILLPHMSNFTDFNVLVAEADVALRYVSVPSECDQADVIIIPGSKNTMADLAYLHEKGFTQVCEDHVSNQKELIGICGGYQMLGQTVADPYGVEESGSTSGLGFLEIETELQREKYTTQVDAVALGQPQWGSTTVKGYQIHMGVTRRFGGQPCFKIQGPIEAAVNGGFDGAMTIDGLVWGSYIHGLFDAPGFRRHWLNNARARKGLRPLDQRVSSEVTACVGAELDRWADHLACYLHVEAIKPRTLS